MKRNIKFLLRCFSPPLVRRKSLFFVQEFSSFLWASLQAFSEQEKFYRFLPPSTSGFRFFLTKNMEAHLHFCNQLDKKTRFQIRNFDPMRVEDVITKYPIKCQTDRSIVK